jgi:hypothetical protein
VHNDAPTKLEYTAGDYMGYNDLGYTLYAVYADDDTYTAFDNPTSKPHMIATEADAENLSAKGFVVVSTRSAGGASSDRPALQGTRYILQKGADDARHLVLRAGSRDVALHVGALSQDGNAFTDDPQSSKTGMGGYCDLGILKVTNSIKPLSEYMNDMADSLSVGDGNDTVGADDDSTLDADAMALAQDAYDGERAPAVNANVQNALVRAIDTSGDGYIGIDDAPVMEYNRSVAPALQPVAVQDAFARFNATGTIADNYDAAPWDAVLASYLGTFSALREYSLDSKSQLTLQDVVGKCNACASRLDRLAPLHKYIAPGDGHSQKAADLDDYGKDIEVPISGYIGSIDTTRPLTFGTDTFSIEDAGMGEAGKVPVRSYRIMAEGQQVGTITGTDHADVDIYATIADAYSSDAWPGYQIHVPFVDNLTGQSDGTAWVAVTRPNRNDGSAPSLGFDANDIGNMKAADKSSEMASEASGAVDAMAASLYVQSHKQYAWPSFGSLGFNGEQSGLWIGVALWLLIVMSVVAVVMLMAIKRNRMRDKDSRSHRRHWLDYMHGNETKR